MSPNRAWRGCSLAIGIIAACALLSLAGEAAAQDAVDSASEGTQLEGQDQDSGYPDEQQPPLGPTDAEVDLDNSFPKRDSVFGFGVPQGYFDWKEETYDRIGLKLGFSYQLVS